MEIYHLELTETNLNLLYGEVQSLQKQIQFLEKIFATVMKCQMRIENLEFNSGVPIDPSIHEQIVDFRLRIEDLEFVVLKKEPKDV